MSRKISNWGMLAIICFYIFTIAISFHVLSPLVSLIIEDLDLLHAQAGMLMTFFSIPGILLTIPAGFLSSRFGIKRVGIVAMLLVILGSTLIFLSRDFTWLLLGRLLVGFGGVTIPIVGLQAIAQLFIGRQMGLAMGIYSACISLASVIPFFTFGAVGVLWGWRSAILIALISSLTAFVLFAALFKLPATAAEPVKRRFSLSPLLKLGWPVWVLAVCWGCFGTANVSLLTFLSDLMYRAGIDLKLAGPITGITMLCGAVFGPPVGHFLDRTRYKSLFLVVPAAVAAVTAFVLPASIRFILLNVIMMGVATSPLGPAIFAIVPAVTTQEKFSLSYGLIFTFSNIGMALGPSITGLIRDVSGSYQYSFWFIALFYLMVGLAAVALLLREIRPARSGDKAATTI